MHDIQAVHVRNRTQDLLCVGGHLSDSDALKPGNSAFFDHIQYTH